MSNQKNPKLKLDDLITAVHLERYHCLHKVRIAEKLIKPGDTVTWEHGGITRSGEVIFNAGSRLQVSARSERGYQYVGIERITGHTRKNKESKR